MTRYVADLVSRDQLSDTYLIHCINVVAEGKRLPNPEPRYLFIQRSPAKGMLRPPYYALLLATDDQGKRLVSDHAWERFGGPVMEAIEKRKLGPNWRGLISHFIIMIDQLREKQRRLGQPFPPLRDPASNETSYPLRAIRTLTPKSLVLPRPGGRARILDLPPVTEVSDPEPVSFKGAWWRFDEESHMFRKVDATQELPPETKHSGTDSDARSRSSTLDNTSDNPPTMSGPQLTEERTDLEQLFEAMHESLETFRVMFMSHNDQIDCISEQVDRLSERVDRLEASQLEGRRQRRG